MKKNLTMPTMPTPSKTPMENMISGATISEVRPEVKMQRTTFLVDSALYKELKKYAVENDVTITSLINDAIRSILNK